MNDYDPKKPSRFISYLDMNNLYGRPMSEYLPYEGFEWLKNVDKLDVMLISKKYITGYDKLILNILTDYINYTMIIY